MQRKYGTLERLSKEEWERVEKEIKKKENKSCLYIMAKIEEEDTGRIKPNHHRRKHYIRRYINWRKQ